MNHQSNMTPEKTFEDVAEKYIGLQTFLHNSGEDHAEADVIVKKLLEWTPSQLESNMKYDEVERKYVCVLLELSEILPHSVQLLIERDPRVRDHFGAMWIITAGMFGRITASLGDHQHS